MLAFDTDLIAQAFAAAAVDPSQWTAAVDAASAATGSFGAILLPIEARMPHMPFSPSLGESVEHCFRDGWHLRDERNRAWPTAAATGVCTDFNAMRYDDIVRHPFYQEFLAPHRLRWFAGVRVASGGEAWCLSIQRTIAQGPFSPAEQHILAGLSDRLSSAAALARAFGNAGAQSALEAFELSGSAVALLNRRSEIIRLNRTAEKLLGGGLRVVRKRLVTHDPSATAALDRALHALMWNSSNAALLPPVPLPRTGARPLLAYPAKLSSMTANALADCRALLVLVDPQKRSRPPEASLRAGFGLSAAEARLATRLSTGGTIEAVADELGIAKETARSQLKSIYAKVGVNRQAELVAMLASLIGM